MPNILHFLEGAHIHTQGHLLADPTYPGGGEEKEKQRATGAIFFILLHFLAHRGLGFLLIYYTVLQWDLPPLRPHCGLAIEEGRRQ